MPVDVIPLARSYVKAAGRVLAAAFQDDPLYAYILPNAEERRRRLPSVFVALVKYVLVYGECVTTPSIDGVACWLRPGKTELTLWRIIRTGLGLQTSVARFPAAARSRFFEVMGYADRAHERLMLRPHWYLWALGVQPGKQGNGIGGALLQPILDRADGEGLPCYLETETAPNVRFYERRAFQVVEEGPVPGHGVPLWMMLREPTHQGPGL